MKGQTGATGLMGPPGPPGPTGHPGPPGPPASGIVAHRHDTIRSSIPLAACVLSKFIFVNYVFLIGLYLVGEKGDKGLPGPPGHCNCEGALGPNNAPFGSYTQRQSGNKVTAVKPHPVTILLLSI